MEPAVKRRSLRDCQRRALRWSAYRTGLLLGMEMRLGKTLAAIRWANTRPSVDRVLVLAPRSVLHVWRDELAAEGLDCVVATGSTTQKERTLEEAEETTRWVVTTHQAIVDLRRGARGPACSNIARVPWDCVIVDESTVARNPRSRFTKVLLKHLRPRFRAMLSGLPNPRCIENFVPQLIWINGDCMGCDDPWVWYQRHTRMTPIGSVPLKKSLTRLRHEVETKTFIMTRQEAGVRDEKIFERRYVELPRKVMRAHENALRDYAIGEREGKYTLEILSWCHRLAGGMYPDTSLQHRVKIDETVRLLREDLFDQRVVVWFRYNDELEAVAEKIWPAGHVVHGGLPDSVREGNIASFKEEPAGVLLAQLQAIKMGIDLSVCDTAIYFSNSYDFEIRAQTEDRLVSVDKSTSNLYIDLVAVDTIDESILAGQRSKRTTAASVLNAAARRHLCKSR